MGEGDLPIHDMMFALQSICYEGYVSLEWVKRWASQLSDAGIVFPHFVHYMEKYMGKGSVRGALFDNRAKTGKYIWEKDTLIDLTFPTGFGAHGGGIPGSVRIPVHHSGLYQNLCGIPGGCRYLCPGSYRSRCEKGR